MFEMQMPRSSTPRPARRRLFGARAMLVLGALLIAFAVPGATPALASHSEITFFEAPGDLLNSRTRTAAFAQLQTLGVTALRVELHWHDVAPAANSRKRPHFDATDPASYDWNGYAQEIETAAKLHWQILLTVTAPVPKWATAAHKDTITRPVDRFFEEFMTALARRFGSEVTYWAVWNEPNIPGWLQPQFNSNGTPASPRIYRGLFQAGYAGLKKGGLSSPKVMLGETAPFGVDTVNPREGVEKEVAPLKFLREALCLNDSYRKSSTCSMLPAYGYAHHPYTYPAVQGPFYRPPNSDQVPIGVLSRLSNALDKAAAAHAIPGRIPIYITEYGVESVPNQLGVSLTEQAEYDAISEQIAWSNPRVASFSQYLLHDEAPHGIFHGYRTGLETQHGGRKPLWYAWPVPLVVLRSGSGYSLWGLVRPTTEATKVHVYVRPAGSSAFRTLAVVSTNSHGYWAMHSSTAGTAWRVSWRSPSGQTFTGPAMRAQ
jgi:hypothetical protein